jgi:hypothetical protein
MTSTGGVIVVRGAPKPGRVKKKVTAKGVLGQQVPGLFAVRLGPTP